MRTFLVSAFCLFGSAFQCQDLLRYEPVKAEIKTGNENLEQVLQTQLNLPKNNQNKYWQADFNVYFLIDSVGHARSLLFKGASLTKGMQREIARLMGLMQFMKTDRDPEIPYYVSFALSGEKYQSYEKQKQKNFIKGNVPADSSLVIFGKSDRSPEYYKGGEEGLKDFLINELEYPPLALQKSVQGTVLLEFIVETNGFITGLNIKQPVGAGCNEEAIRLIKKTRWQPAQLNGKLVRYRMTYPITFSLRNVTRDSGF